MRTFVQDSAMNHHVGAPSQESWKDASIDDHVVEKELDHSRAEEPELENSTCAFGCLVSTWEVISDSLLEILIERVLRWPSFVWALVLTLFFDFVFLENIPNFVWERMVLLYKSSALPTSSERNGMFTSWVLMHPFSEVEFLSMDNPMVWINFFMGEISTS